LRRETRRNFPDGRTPSAITRNALIGSPTTLVEGIIDVITGGDFDWLGFYLPDYVADLEFFGCEVLPRLVAQGVGVSSSPHPILG
jgi:hypothetical protein